MCAFIPLKIYKYVLKIFIYFLHTIFININVFLFIPIANTIGLVGLMNFYSFTKKDKNYKIYMYIKTFFILKHNLQTQIYKINQ